MQSDGPENFIDPASNQEASTGSSEEPSRTMVPGSRAEHEATKAKYEAEKARYEAVKAKHEASAKGWTKRHARKRSLTDLWRDWISLGILVVTALTGIGTILAGVVTETTQVLVAGVAILSGTSGTAIVGLTRNRPPDDGGHNPSP